MKILTFDIEEWFHLLDLPATRSPSEWEHYPERIDENVQRILEIIGDKECSATFFCLGWVAERYPHIIRRIAHGGYEIGSHSHWHQLAYEQTPSAFRQDLRRSIRAIEDAAGVQVTTYRIPGFSLTARNLWVFEILAEEGITVDCSVFPAQRGHGGLPMFKSDRPARVLCGNQMLRELPINTQPLISRSGASRVVFSGGGYFRLLPLPMLERLFARHEYVMTYFHPRDFDPDQPVVSGLSPIRRFKSYVGLRRAEGKLRYLLSRFDFMDVRSAVAQVDWSQTPEIRIW